MHRDMHRNVHCNPNRNSRAVRVRALFLPAALLALAALAGPAVPSLVADELPAERAALLAHLDYTENLLLSATEGVTHQQAEWRASDDRWSVVECVEHLAKSEVFLRQRLEELMASEAAEPLPTPTAGDLKVLATVADRSQTFQAPDGLRPERSFESLEAALAEFRKEREKTREAVRSLKGDMRSHIAPGPFGPADAHQWVLFLSGHTERHSLQVLEVLGEPGFPAK